MARPKFSKPKFNVVYLEGPGFFRSLLGTRVRRTALIARAEADAARQPPVRRPVRFMWDYRAYPVWDDVHLPTELMTSLQDWSDEGTKGFTGQVEPPDSWLEGWADRGRALAYEVALVVGEVEYHNQATDEIERITATNAPPQHG